MAETPITDLFVKMVEANTDVAIMIEAVRALELALSTSLSTGHSTGHQVDIPPDRLDRRRKYDREYKRKRRSLSTIVSTDLSTGQSSGQVDIGPLTKKGTSEEVIGIQEEVRKKNTASVNGRAEKVSRGSRLPDDWQPSAADVDYAVAQGLRNFDIETEATKFRNYWTNRTDRQGSKPRWDRAWQNWILNVRGTSNGKATPGDRLREVSRKLKEIECSEGAGRSRDIFGGGADSSFDSGPIPVSEKFG